MELLIYILTLLLFLSTVLSVFVFFPVRKNDVVACWHNKRSVFNCCKRICLFFIVVLTFFSCQERLSVNRQKVEVDSLVNAAYMIRDYEGILTLTDLHQSSGTLSPMKVCYWRGYAYSRLRKMRLAEVEWKKAVSLSVDNQEDLLYYAHSANRLSGLLYFKFDYEGTIRVAVPAIKLLKEKQYTMNTDYANLLAFFGSCQLKLGHHLDAANNYMLAWQHYLQAIESSDDIKILTSTVIGIVSITDAYIKTGHFREALDWTNRFEKMLSLYRQHPQSDNGFIDKQWARLNLYRGCVYEGLGRSDEASEAYRIANSTQYAKTSDGQIEATNYLITAQRWEEAADNFTVLERQLGRYDMKITLENIRTYLLPKYKANIGANRRDSAIAVSMWICNSLDTAITVNMRNNAAELATLYDTQQKETEIAEQRASLSHQRFMSTVIILIIVIIAFCLFIYLRHKAALRLETAYHHLEIANARAEESSRMKSDFIQQISHEIRTPLNILSGFTQVITTPNMELDENTRADINRQITENTNRITGLVNKMLELSESNSETVIEKNDFLNVVQIAAEAADASGITTARHLTFDLEVSPEVESFVIQTNHRAAVRALSLLLDNARKFTNSAEAHHQDCSGDTLQHAILRVTADSKQVVFIVEDTGIGVPKQESERIFQEFVQLDEYYDGTGIGLTVARSLARRLGGDVILDTTYTSGARFVLTLPIMLLSAGNEQSRG